MIISLTSCIICILVPTNQDVRHASNATCMPSPLHVAHGRRQFGLNCEWDCFTCFILGSLRIVLVKEV
jgi:hypothetical protein